MASIDDKIKAQEEKLKQLKTLKQKQEALARAAKSKQERADDTRRKVLLGALLMEKMESDTAVNEEMRRQLSTWLKRPDDRKLFGFQEMPNQPKVESPQA